MTRHAARRRSALLTLFAATTLLAGVLLPVQDARAAVYAGYSEYFIPGREEQMWGVFRDLDLKIAANLGQAAQLVIGQGMRSIISITVTGDDTTVYYDHWEDGYDFDPENPDATYDQKWVKNAGEVIILESANIPVNPRGTAVYYDGGDRIFVAGTSVTVSRSSWPESAGPVFALGWELFPVKPFLTHYTIPVGRDIAVNSPFYSDFERVYVLAQSVTDNNVVQIDDPATPFVDKTVTLNRGETTELFDVNTGTRVIGQQPVQVQIVVGSDTRDRYECRGFNAMPEALWDNEYYSPVGSAANGADTDIFIYNPHSTAIILAYEDTTGAGSFTIPAHSTRSYRDGAGRYVPVNSGAFLRSDNVFWGISAVDSLSRTYDWGFDLVPANFLTDEYFLSWAPGTSDTNPTQNGSPAYVTPIFDDTVIFVDYSPTDGVIDLTVTRDRLQSLKIFDPDNVNTGMHIFATGPFAVVWGQDPDTAGEGNPYLDLGVANLPLPPEWIDLTLGLEKSADPTVLPPAPGETTDFTVKVITYEFPVADIAVTDILPAGFGYVNNSALITLPGNIVISGAAANPAISGQTLTWSNATLGNLDMAAGKVLTITYRVVTDATVGQGYYTNTAQASGNRLLGSQVFSPFDSAIINVTPVVIDKDSVDKTVSPGGSFVYRIRVKNISSTQATGITIADVLPSGLTYNSQVNYQETAGVTRTGVSNPTAGQSTLNWGTWTLDSQGQVTIDFRVNVGASVPPGTYDNTASAAGTWAGAPFTIDDKGEVGQDLGTPSGEDPADDDDVTVVSLLLDMDTTTPAVMAGGQATYVIVVKNEGATTISAVDISASLPPGFTYASTTSIVPTNAARPATINPAVGASDPAWGRWDIGPGGEVVITFVADVAATVLPGTFDASAFASSPQTGLIDDAGPVAADAHTLPTDTGTDEDVTVQTAVLTIDKDSLVKYAVRGDTPVTWEIVVRNEGTATATNVVISDPLPAGFTFNSNDGAPVETLATRTSTSDPAPGATSPSWGTWTIQPGGSVAVRFKANVGAGVAGGTYSNTAGVTSTQTGYVDDLGTVAQDNGTPAFIDPVDDEDVTIFTAPTDDLAVAITHTENDASDDVTYAVAVSNNGPSGETGLVTVVVTLPAGIDYKGTFTGSGWAFSGQAGQQLTFTYAGGLAAGASLPTLTVNAAFSPTIVPVDARASATVSGTITDYNAANNTALDPIAVKVSDLSTATKTFLDINGGDVEPGDILEYTITVIETGDRTARAVSVTDDVPANVTAFTVTAVPFGATNASTPTGGANGTGFLDVSGFDVPPLGTVTIKFRVTVDAGLPTGTLIDNTAVIDNPKGIGASPAAPTAVVRGSTLPASGIKPLYLYQNLDLSRAVPAAAQGTITLANTSNANTGNPPTQRQELTLTPATQKELRIRGGATTAIPVPLWLSRGDNPGYSYRRIYIRLAATGAVNAVIGTYQSTADITDMTTTAQLYNFTVPIDTGSSLWNAGTGELVLPAGTAITLTLASIRVPNVTNVNRDILVHPDGDGTTRSQVQLDASTVVNVDSVTFYSAPYPGGSPVANTIPGATVYVRAVVSDPFGSADITGAALSMVDPEGVVRLNASAMTQVDDNGAATKTFEGVYTFPAGGPVDYWTASVTAAEGSEGTVTDTGVAAIAVLPAAGADLSITKTHVGTFARGQEGAFIIRARNNGPEPQTADITVTDALPAGLTYVGTAAPGWNVSVLGGTITWTYPASAGSPVPAGTLLPPITLTVSVDSGIGASVANTATVNLGVGENNPGNNTATDTVAILDLAVVKTVNAGPQPYYSGDNAGEELTYTIEVTNASTAPVYKVSVRDLLPAGVAFVSGSTQVSAPDHRIRVTEYFIAPGDFPGTVYELVLKQDLAQDYFVIIQGSDGDGTQDNDRGPDENYAALVGDPFGSGDLAGVSRPDAIRLFRNGAVNPWVGVVTVVESLAPGHPDGFRLLGAVRVTQADGDGSGTAASPIGWSDLSRVMLVGGFNGAGADSTQTDPARTRNVFTRYYPSGGNTINWVRGNTQGLTTATVMVVQWGAGWNVQHAAILNGNNGGDGANAPGEYNTVAISSVSRANTWVWGTGYTNDNGIGDAGEGVLLTLGDGAAQNASESLLAAGIEYGGNAVNFDVYALNHPALQVQHIFKADGDAASLIVNVPAAQPLQGYGMGLSYNGQGATNTTYPRPMLSARFFDRQTIRLERRRSGTAFPAWVQGIDFSGFVGPAPVTQAGNAPPYLVTAEDGYSLQPGEKLTVTFRATIDNALKPGDITNTVLVSADGFADTAVATAPLEVRTLGVPDFTDASGSPVSGGTVAYSGEATGAAYLKLYDPDRNTDSDAIDTVTVTVINPLNNDRVTVTLYETGKNTGIFANNASGQRFELPMVSCEDPQANCCSIVPSDPDCNPTLAPTAAASLWVVPGTSPNLQIVYSDPSDSTRDSVSASAFIATLVVLSDVGAYVENGQGVVYWETASEIGTAAFTVMRQASGETFWSAVNPRPVPSLRGVPQGGFYRLLDPAAVFGETVSYFIEEIEASGRINRYGPFTVTVGDRPPRLADLPAMSAVFSRDGHALNGKPRPMPRMTALSRSAMADPSPGDAVKISVAGDGLYFVSSAQIAALLGLDAGDVAGRLASAGMALTRAGRPVPYLAADGGAGLYFYGAAIDSPYTDTNVYWIREGEGVLMGGPVAGRGDVTGSGGVGLADAIAALKVAAGTPAADAGVRGDYSVFNADVNGNGRVDLAEALYAVQTLSGVRVLPPTGGDPIIPAADAQYFTATLHLEQNLIALTDFFNDPEADFWVWGVMTAGDPGNDVLGGPVYLEGWTEAGPVNLAVDLFGGNAAAHHVMVTINGIPVGEALWNGIGAYRLIISDVPASLIRNDGTDLIGIKAVLDSGVAFSTVALDSVTATYPHRMAVAADRLAFIAEDQPTITVTGFSVSGIRVLNVSNPDAPVVVDETLVEAASGGYRVSFHPAAPQTPYLAVVPDPAMVPASVTGVFDSDLKDPGNSADFLVIAPAALTTAAKALADHRSGQGLSSRVVDFTQVVDTFNDGIYSPLAIRQFLVYAREQWQTPPRFVVLAGNGTYDYRNVQGDNLLPTLLMGTPQGLFATDQRLADVAGTPDGIPDLAIGRLPALDAAELTAMIDRIIAFESGSGPWRSRAVMSAGLPEHPGEVNDFTADSQSVIADLPAGITVETVYVSNGATHTDLVAALNTGEALFNYLGHGGYDRLGGNGLLTLADIPNLTNADSRPVMTALTCIVGNYGMPGIDALGEAMLKSAGGGAVAVWSPSGLSINTKAVDLNREYARQLAATADRRLGSVIVNTLGNYFLRTGDSLLIGIYNLLGDPAMLMPVFQNPDALY